MSKVRYELERVSEEAKTEYLQHMIDEFATRACGPRLLRIFEEATVPEPLTAKEVVEKVREWSNPRRYHRDARLLEFLEGLNVE